jgi:hypothetical protein
MWYFRILLKIPESWNRDTAVKKTKEISSSDEIVTLAEKNCVLLVGMLNTFHKYFELRRYVSKESQ